MKRINNVDRLFMAFVITLGILYMASCEKETDKPTGDNKVVLTSTTAGSPEYFSVNVSSSLTQTGGQTITDHGYCYGTAPNPDINSTVKSLGKRTEQGDFSAELTNLEDNKRYYIRAFATIAGGTLYAEQKEITTLKAGKPRISTSPLSDIRFTSAVCGGTIESDSGYAVTASGICWDIDNQFNENQCLGKVVNTTGNTTYMMNIEGLTEGTNYFIKAYATNQKGTGYGEIRQFSTVPVTIPDVTTANITNPTTNSATGGGNVTNAGNATVTARGVCWNTTGNPTLQNCINFTTNGNGTGSFTSNIANLTDGVKYYVRAYATNSKGTGYGAQVDFTTLDITLPTVNTAEITNPTTNSATGGGNVTNAGNATVTARGVCWNTTGNPTLQNCINFTTNGNGTGSFTSNITGLSDGVTYYVKAYATNSEGTGYGTQVNFTTLAITLPTVTTAAITNPTTNSATGGGNVTNSGNTTVTARGVCWNTTGNPTLQNCINFTTNGNGTGSFTSNITGLTDGVTYYVKAYATNGEGTGYGTQVNFTTMAITLPTVTTTTITNPTTNSATGGGNVTNAGNSTVTARGVCWNTNGNPTLQNCINFTTNGSGTGSFISNITGLSDGVTYYVKAYATNVEGTGYGTQVNFTTLAITLPTLTTAAITNPTSNSATGGGNVTNSGNATVTARGVCWNTTGNPTLQNCINFTSDGSGTGSFSSNLTGLTPSTTYFVKAFAQNSEGTAYGNQVNFTTVPWSCGAILSITHTAGSIAPVNKTVNYGTVQTNLTGSNKCWITQNLGADRQATSATDNTEASAGWYWQFNKKQGYKHDGTTRTPNTTWITSINENSDWLPANDPCTLLLGSGWRLPTGTEWQTADANGGWDNYNETFGSVLKLHAAGNLTNSVGSLGSRGVSGNYWSSSQTNSDYGRNLNFSDGFSGMYNYDKAYGFTARCLRD
jgi:uncharacterized membrane protein